MRYWAAKEPLPMLLWLVADNPAPNLRVERNSINSLKGRAHAVSESGRTLVERTLDRGRRMFLERQLRSFITVHVAGEESDASSGSESFVSVSTCIAPTTLDKWQAQWSTFPHSCDAAAAPIVDVLVRRLGGEFDRTSCRFTPPPSTDPGLLCLLHPDRIGAGQISFPKATCADPVDWLADEFGSKCVAVDWKLWGLEAPEWTDGMRWLREWGAVGAIDLFVFIHPVPMQRPLDALDVDATWTPLIGWERLPKTPEPPERHQVTMACVRLPSGERTLRWYSNDEDPATLVGDVRRKFKVDVRICGGEEL